MLTNRVVVGVFTCDQQAQAAIRALEQAGFRDEQIGLAVRDKHATVDLAHKMEEESRAQEGAALGVAAGAGLGTAWALGITAGLLPAIGSVIAGGVVASVLASAAIGAAAGGLVGALVGAGIPEEHTDRSEEHVHSGNILISVDAADRCDEARAILDSSGAIVEEESPELHFV